MSIMWASSPPNFSQPNSQRISAILFLLTLQTFCTKFLLELSLCNLVILQTDIHKHATPIYKHNTHINTHYNTSNLELSTIRGGCPGIWVPTASIRQMISNIILWIMLWILSSRKCFPHPLWGLYTKNGLNHDHLIPKKINICCQNMVSLFYEIFYVLVFFLF